MVTLVCSHFDRWKSQRRVLCMGDVQTTMSLQVNIEYANRYMLEYSCINADWYAVVAVNEEQFCQSETFRPRCLPGEAVIISKAIYGRMSDTARCLQNEEELPELRGNPKYMGCFEDVLQSVSARCSVRPDCEIRIPDPEMEKTNPCYRHMAKYLEVTYHCITGMTL